MYLTARKFYLILIISILGLSSFAVVSFASPNHTIISTNLPTKRIVLTPLTTQPVRASEETIAESPTTDSVSQPVTELPTIATVQTPKPAPRPVVKAAAATIQTVPTPTIQCSGGLTIEFLCLLNQYRASKGKSKLSGNSSLSKVALTHSSWMSSTGTFSHVGINGSRLSERCKTAGITCRGENLAYNISSAQELLKMWAASPTHNANLLGNYSAVGMGVYGNYTTLLFN